MYSSGSGPRRSLDADSQLTLHYYKNNVNIGFIEKIILFRIRLVRCKKDAWVKSS